MWWMPEEFKKKRSYLEKRMKIVRCIREFFYAQDFWEVETPALQSCPAVDRHIHAFKTLQKGVDLRETQNLYLHTSPEIAMKKLLVAGVPKLYQICHAFRNGEGSALHSPEFTMLEWYRAGVDYRVLMDDCVDILRKLALELGIETYAYGGKNANPFKDWEIISVSEVFLRYVKLEIGGVIGDRDMFAAALVERGVRVSDSDDWDDLFHAAMAEKVEPHLGDGVPTILYDYPACLASLSRLKPEDARFCERFELYVCGVELGNAFSELTDADEQRTRFKIEMNARERLYGERYPVDENFMKALEYGLPESAGIALGVDRLVMLACGAESIEQVSWCA